MKVIRRGSEGNEVRSWQLFLIGQGYKIGKADGDFGDRTFAATKDFQKKHRLKPDGVVGNRTWGTAMTLGYHGIKDEEYENGLPPLPDFKPLSRSGREKVFGAFEFNHTPTKNNREKITITDGWDRENILRVELKGLDEIGPYRAKAMRFHKSAKDQLEGLWSAWDKAGLLKLVLSYEGAFVPRFQRGGVASGALSNHAWGTAFDINYKWNRLGHMPAPSGAEGSVTDLVGLAHEHGFYWGGHFKKRADGMHFEVAKLL